MVSDKRLSHLTVCMRHGMRRGGRACTIGHSLPFPNSMTLVFISSLTFMRKKGKGEIFFTLPLIPNVLCALYSKHIKLSPFALFYKHHSRRARLHFYLSPPFTNVFIGLLVGIFLYSDRTHVHALVQRDFLM